MTRSKVLDEQRKRIGQACKGCQNRKQKCDGQNPCSGCEKRGHNCSYDPLRKRKSVTRIPKNDGIVPCPKHFPIPFPLQGIKPEPGNSPPLRSPLATGFFPHGPYGSPSAMSEWSSPSDVQLDRYEPVAAPRVPSQSGVPVCGSSSASFLAEIKRLVLPMSGPCPFTEGHDNLSRMGSHSRSLALTGEVPLPGREIAEHLVKRARQYSNHLVEILDESTIQELLRSAYSKLPPQEPGSLCLLYLLLAVGSLAVEPQKSTEYPDLFPVDSFRSADKYFEFAEATLRKGGYETFEVWMIQAWALMTTYSLAVSNWNAADVYIGLAVRAADVLGINHAPGSSRASSEVKTNSALHSKLWKCLFVLDSLVAALLGRQPQALKEEKSKPTTAGAGTDCSPPSPTGRDECLAFNVASAKMIRKTIKLVYNQRHFPAERASSMLQQAQLCPPPSPVCFQGQDDADTLATQHAILFRNYAAMLLTRPFFVQELFQSSKQKHDTTWKYLSTTCVLTAHQSVERIYEAHSQSSEFRNDYMWRPCLYTAVLIILTNQFFDFYKCENSIIVVEQAFAILKLWNARNPTEEGELNSLSLLRRLIDEQMPRRLPVIGGGGGPMYVDMAYGAAAAVGYDVPGSGRTGGGVFPTHDFAACADSPYCGSDGRRYSAAPDYMDSAPVGGTGITQLGAWSTPALPSINLARCASDAGCYGFAMQQDGYEADAMQVTQDYTAYPGPQVYLS